MPSLDEFSDAALWESLSSVEGEERVEVLVELSHRAYRSAEFTRSAELAGQAATEAALCLPASSVEECFYWQGRALLAAGDFPESMEAFREGTRAYAEPDRRDSLSRNLWGVATCHYRLQEYPLAVEAAADSVEAALADEDFEQAGLSQLLMTRALYMDDEELNALESAELARDLYRTVPDPDGVLLVDDFTATILLFLGRTAEADEILERCLLMAETIADERAVAYAQTRLANARGQQGNHDDAIALLEDAEAAYHRLGDLAEVAQCRTSLARHHERMDNQAEAIDLARAAAALWDALGADLDYLKAQALLSRLMYANGRFDEAIRVNRRIMDAALASTEPETQSQGAWALLRLADDHVALSEWSSVLEVLDVDSYWDSSADSAGRLWKSALRARALYALGRPEEALGVADSALAATVDADVNINTAYLYEIKARVSIEQGRPDRERHLAHAIALHLAVGDDDVARDLADHFRPSFAHDARDGFQDSPDGKGALS